MALPPLEALVPHRAPMMLLDEVTHFEGPAVTCVVTVREGAMFVREGAVPAAVFLEYMAQAAAAHAGLSAQGERPRKGYLLGAREMKLHVDGAPVGARLTVRATLDWDDGVTALYLAEVEDEDGRALASAQLNVHRGEARKLT